MIRAFELSKSYQSVTAVHDLSFDIEAGHVVGFLGLNGAGKTTILRMLAGDLAPSSGSIHIDGHDLLSEGATVKRLVGFLPETPPLYPEMTVRDFLRYVGGLREMSGSALRDRIVEVAANVQMSDRLDHLVSTLSHGFRKRLGIAQAIVHRPPLVILDEPISGLDPVQISEMRTLIRGLRGEHTVLLSSHILPEISQTCDRLLVLGAGEIVADGTEQELTERAVGSSERVTLSLRADAEAAKQALEAVEGVTSVTVTGQSQPQGSDALCELEVQTNGDQREQLVRAAVEANLGVRAVGRAAGELENVFLELTMPSA